MAEKRSILDMTEQQLASHVRAIAKDSKNIIETIHARDERMKQRGLSSEDVHRCLKFGQMVRAPEPGHRHDELKCRFNYKDIDAKPYGVEVAVSDTNPKLIVVTVVRYSH